MAVAHHQDAQGQAFGFEGREQLAAFIQDVVARPGFILPKPPSFRRERWGTAAPTAGTWKVGDVTWNVAPASGGFMGWVCKTAGTPGSWTTFGPVT